MKYKCSKCGQEHEGRPAIAFDSPFHYNSLNDEDKKSIATLTGDFCVIKHEDQTDRFIRTVIHQKVNDDCQTLDYGVWVSLSEKSYKDYYDNYDNENHVATYFGRISNILPGYEDTLSVEANVVLRGKIRPEVIPHDDQDNDFVTDYYNGIDKDAADERVKKALGDVST
jgi:hypothetical protein